MYCDLENKGEYIFIADHLLECGLSCCWTVHNAQETEAAHRPISRQADKETQQFNPAIRWHKIITSARKWKDLEIILLLKNCFSLIYVSYI